MTTQAKSWTKLTPDQFFQKQQEAQTWLKTEMGTLGLDQIQALSNALQMALDSMIESLDESSDPVVFRDNFLVIRDLHINLTHLLK
jgi:hypothetical protein